MAVTSIDIDSEKLARLKRLTGARSNREAVDEALDLALGVRQKRALVDRITSRGFTPEWHEETKQGPKSGA